MHTKFVKDLEIGDRIMVVEPSAVARITSKQPSRLFRASGGCFRLDARIESGPHKGETISDQHHPGDAAVELAE